MEAIIAILKNLLKNTTVAIVTGAILGLSIGLLIGYVLWPVQWTDMTPVVLRADLQRDYLRMTIDSYNRTGDPNVAMERWNNLGEAANTTYQTLLTEPGYLNPADIQTFGGLVQSVQGAPIPPADGTGTEVPGSTLTSPLLIASAVVLLLVLGVSAYYVSRLLRRGSGAVTPVMQGAEISRQVEKTNYQSLGIASPITQIVTTYMHGDDLYDESSAINSAGGEFLGEYGVGISDIVGVGTPKKVAALEIWLFDKNDIKTATKVLMSEHAYNDPTIRARLEPKGELVVVKPQEEVLLETATLQLLAKVVDVEYGKSAMPQNSYFEQLVIELAVWPRQTE